MTPTETIVAALAGDILGTDAPADAGADFVDDLGGDSLSLVRLLVELERRVGKDLPIGRAPADTTIAGLARLADVPDGLPAALRHPPGTAPPLFLLHSYLGAVLRYRTLTPFLPDDLPLVALEPLALEPPRPDRDRSDRCPTGPSIESMADAAVAQIRRLRPHGPYRLGGHSIGGLVAVEVAQRLRAAGDHVEVVVLIDTPARTSRRQYWWAEIVLNLPDQWAADRSARLAFVRGAVASRLPRRSPAPPAVPATAVSASASPRITGALRRAGEASNLAVKRYRSSRYPGDVVVLRTFHGVCMAGGDRTLGWGPLVGGTLTVLDIPGEHGTVFDPDNVAVVGHRLAEVLAALPGGPSKSGPA